MDWVTSTEPVEKHAYNTHLETTWFSPERMKPWQELTEEILTFLESKNPRSSLNKFYDRSHFLQSPFLVSAPYDLLCSNFFFFLQQLSWFLHVWEIQK
jgi:hypothetical protein